MVLEDASFRVVLARERMEAVAHDAWQVDVLHKGDLVNTSLRGRLRLSRAERQVSEYAGEVRP